MKAFKYILFGIAGLLVLAIVAIAVFALTFEPNRYKDQIESAVKDATGRTLKLQGDLKVAIFPSLGAGVNSATLSEAGSDQEFLSLDTAHGSVELMPLIRGEIIVDRITVRGLDAQVVKDSSGRFNFQDLLEKDTKTGTTDAKAPAVETGRPVRFDIAGVNVERSSVTYKDLATGRELTFSDVELTTGRIAEKADGQLDFAAAVKGSDPPLDLKTRLSGNYRIDVPASAYSLSNVEGALNGTLDSDAVEAKLSAPRIDIAADKASGDAVVAAFTLQGPRRSAEIGLKIDGIEGSAKALVVPQLSATLALSGPDMPREMRVPLSGSARADLEKQTASADLTSTFEQSNIQAKLGLTRFDPPAYVFDINVDKLDLDQYFPPQTTAAAGKDAPAGKSKPAANEADTPIDLSMIKDLNANGRLQVGALQARGIRVANLKAEVKAANGRVDVSPHSADLYEGALAGSLNLQAKGNRVSLKERLSNVSIGPLLQDIAQQDRLTGRGNVTLDVTGAGATMNALKRSLDGSATLNLRDGAIKGIDIGALLSKVKSLGRLEEGSANTRDETTFTELNASFTIRDGVASNKDLDIKSPLVRIGGAGDIDIASATLDYTVKASVVASTKGQGGAGLEELSGLTVPVKLAGPFDALKYQVDFGAVAGELAKSRIGDALKERIGGSSGSGGEKIEDQLRDRLKGLLGR